MDHWADYVIFIGFLMVSVGIGIYHAFSGGKQQTNEEFIMGNRKMQIVPTAISLIVSSKSALLILGAPAEMYTRGIAFWPGGQIAIFFAAIVIAHVIIPWLYPLKLTSVFHFYHQYFRSRYGANRVETLATIIGLLFALLYNSIGIYAPSTALEIATGFPVFASMPIMAVVCIIYTTLGGMKAVIWTDVFQSLIMMAGILTITIKGVLRVGGIGEVFDLFRDEGRLTFDNYMSPDPTVRHTIWGFFIGYFLHSVTFFGLQQSSVQRFSAVPTLKQSQSVVYVWYTGSLIMASSSYIMGIVVFAYFAQKQCDPFASGIITNSNQVLPLFVKEVFHGVHGFTGLFLATLYSATLSTISSTLSGASANAWNDLIQPRWPHTSERMATIISKSMVVLFGILSTALAFGINLIKGPLIQIAISLLAACTGPVFGLFILAGVRIFRWVKWQGVIIGGAFGFGFITWLNLGAVTVKYKHPPLLPVSVEMCQPPVNASHVDFPKLYGLQRFYTISYVWYTLIGILVTILFAMLASWLISFCTKDVASNQVYDKLFLKFKSRKKNSYNVKMIRDNGQPLTSLSNY